MYKVFSLAFITFKEGIRNRTLLAIALFALSLLVATFLFVGFFMRDLGKVAVDINLSAISFAGLLVVFFIGTNLLSKDIDKKTIQVVLSKPFSRSQYIFGKFLGLFSVVTVCTIILFIVSIFNLFFIRSLYPDYFLNFIFYNYVLAYFFIVIKLSVVLSFVVLFSSLASSSFLSLFYSMGLYLSGVTIDDVVFYLKSERLLHSMSHSETLVKLIDGVSMIVPNLSVLNFKVEAAHGLVIEAGRALSAAAYGSVYVALMLALASLTFSRREFN